MSFRFIILFLVAVLFAPLAQAQTHTFVLQHRQLGRSVHNNWLVNGSKAVRMTSLYLNEVPRPGQSIGALLRGSVRYENSGAWTIEAYRLSPGRYRVWHTRLGSQPWFKDWTIPVMRPPGGGYVTVTHLNLNKQLPNAVLSGVVRFNRAGVTSNTVHGATLQPKR